MLKNAVLDVKKFAYPAENEPFEVPKRANPSSNYLNGLKKTILS